VRANPQSWQDDSHDNIVTGTDDRAEVWLIKQNTNYLTKHDNCLPTKYLRAYTTTLELDISFTETRKIIAENTKLQPVNVDAHLQCNGSPMQKCI